MNMTYPRLFSPLSLNGCLFPNRIMLTPMVSRLATEDGHITVGLRERYKRIARGGPGAMVLEPAVVLPSKSSFNLRINDDPYVSELREFVDELRTLDKDLKIGLQLIHFLKVARSGWRQKVEDLKRDDIRVIPEQFATGAKRAQAAGFDFIELHMAHFTTLASFLSRVNQRKDRYGGDFEGRVKLPTEVILAVRESVGRDFPVGVRINGEDFTKEGNTLRQSTRIARHLAQMGVDYLSVSAGERFEDAEMPPPNTPPFAGTGYSGYRMSPRWWHPDGTQVYLAGAIRQAVRDAGKDVPIVTAGKIRTPDLAERILEQGRADIIGLARPLLSDPDWPMKAKNRQADEIVRCAACGYCNEADERYETITCVQWPRGALNAPSPWLLFPPCRAACPAGVDVRSHIELITEGRYIDALNMIEEKIPLPGTISRVCPRPCQEKCNRAELDDSVAINALKRFVVDTVASRQERKEVTPVVQTKPQKVAIIGAGPAGLAAAYHLVKSGYGATIFEALPVPGGMLAVGIPEYRLPKSLVQMEIDNIRRLGVEIKLNTQVGRNGLAIDCLWQQGYEAVFLATGAHRSLKLTVPGADLKGVFHGAMFLRDVNLGREIRVPAKVAVVGGGNLAVDAARTALRLGAKAVFIVYRRSEEEIPAYREEVEAAEAEGIRIQYLATPVRVVGRNGRVTGIECVRTELAGPDADGRRRPVPITGSELVSEAGMVISATGEVPDLSFLSEDRFDVTPGGTIKVDPQTLATSMEGVFAGGDAVSGPATVIDAMAAGRKAAESIDRYFHGQTMVQENELPRIIGMDDLDTTRFKKRRRQRMPALPPRRRIHGFREVQQGFGVKAALCEADRCLRCGMYPKKEHDKCNGVMPGG